MTGWGPHTYAIPPGARVRLAKKTSNLFRPRDGAQTAGLDVSGLDGVIAIDTEAQTADVQGMCTYEDLVAETLPHGLMPYVVPQLKTITLGGAVTGLGIESTSFRHGLPHESVLEMDILTGSGEIVTATPDGEHSDLFDAFPNSYGSLGYATRLKIKLEKVPAYVNLRHVRSGRRGVGGQDDREHRRDRRVGGRTRRRPRRHGVQPRRDLLDARGVHRRQGTDERLHRPADLLPLDPAARDRHVDDPRTTSGAGTPTGSGAQAHSAPRTSGSARSGRRAGAAATSITASSASTRRSA